MDETPVILMVFVSIFTTLLIGFIYLGGKVLILASKWVPVKTRLRWAGLSTMPLILLLATAIISGNEATPSRSTGNFTDMFNLVGLLAGLGIVGIIYANWFIFRKFRAIFPRSKN